MLSNQHAPRAAIATLRGFARNIGLREDDAVTAYEAEVQRLKTEARVTRYVDVIAEKRTRDQLRTTVQSVAVRRAAAGGARKERTRSGKTERRAGSAS